jgi:hypothetical protein
MAEWIVANPWVVVLGIAIGAPVAGAVVTRLIRLIRPDMPALKTWVITSGLLVALQATGAYLALSAYN